MNLTFLGFIPFFLINRHDSSLKEAYIHTIYKKFKPPNYEKDAFFSYKSVPRIEIWLDALHIRAKKFDKDIIKIGLYTLISSSTHTG